MSAALRIPRTFFRIVGDAARAESSFLRFFNACCGYFPEHSLPALKAEVAGAPKSGQASTPTFGLPHGPSQRPVYPSREARAETRAKEPGPRERSRSPVRHEPAPFEDNWGGRCLAWTAGKDPQGSLRGLCKNCYVGTGERVPRHIGASCQGLGNRCYIPRRLPKCRESNACHWAQWGIVFGSTCVCPTFVRLRPVDTSCYFEIRRSHWHRSSTTLDSYPSFTSESGQGLVWAHSSPVRPKFFRHACLRWPIHESRLF